MERLTAEEMQDVLARAGEIQRHEQAKIEWTTELQQWVHAAEEAGFTRESVEQALRERVAVQLETPEIGSWVFAKSTDGRFYVAKLLQMDNGVVQVEFIKGGACKLPLVDVRPMNLLPGSKVECDWPHWGWWTCNIVSYNRELNTIQANDGFGQTQVFPISEIRMRGEKQKPSHLLERYGAAFGALLAGSGVGVLITWLIMR